MSKSDEKKKEKEESLLDTAFQLFTKKGFKETSIQDIADNAGVGKGTFYLYFKDKYDIKEKIIQRKSKRLFSNAITALHKTDIKVFEDQIIFIIEHITDELAHNQILLKFIAKDLSLGVYNEAISNITNITDDSNEETVLNLFMNGVKKNNIKLDNPETTLFMIIELASSTIFNSILHEHPLPIKEFKPILFKTIRIILKNDNK
jgi:AcrR family transcriptional regulator